MCPTRPSRPRPTRLPPAAARRLVASLALGALPGCITITVPPDVIPLLYLQKIQAKDAPAIRRIDIDGQTWTFAKLGLTLLDLETRVAFLGIVAAGVHKGAWPQFEAITVAGVTWNASIAGGNLLLEAQPGTDSPVRTALLTPDGYMSIDEQLVPVFERMQRIVDRSRTPFPPPVVPVIPR